MDLNRSDLGSPTPPPAIESKASLLRLVGPSGVLDVWLGDAGDPAALEADVRAVSARGAANLPALAMALGDFASRHELELRVIQMMDPTGRSVLVLFGRRTCRAK